MKSRYLIFAALLLVAFAVAFLIYISGLHLAVVGDVPKDSEAYKANFRFGDQIQSLDGSKIPSWEHFVTRIARGAKGPLVAEVVRRNGDVAHISLDPTGPGGVPTGLTNIYQLPIIGLRSNSPLERYGVESGDKLLSIGKFQIRGWTEIEDLLAQQDPMETLNIEIYSAKLKRSLAIGVVPLGVPYSCSTLGIENPKWFVRFVQKGSVGEKLGIEARDRILLVQGQSVNDAFDAKRFSLAVQTEKKIGIDVVRGMEVRHLQLDWPTKPPVPNGGFATLLDFLGLENLISFAASDLAGIRNPLMWWQFKMGGRR